VDEIRVLTVLQHRLDDGHLSGMSGATCPLTNYHSLSKLQCLSTICLGLFVHVISLGLGRHAEAFPLHQALYRFFPAPASRPYQMEALPDWHAGSVTSVYTRGTTTNRYEQPSLQCLQSPQHLRSYSSVRRLQQDMILLYDHQRGM
jgi:hypothetical protein